MYGIESVTPTICAIFRIPVPEGVASKPVEEVLRGAEKTLQGRPVEKALLYAPDAIGEWLYQAHRDEFKPVLRAAPIQVKMRSVSPSYTPVCYGSMFTGLKPEGHGIRKYEKPVLRCPTLFDALAEAGKRVAIVAVKGSSIDLIFRERPISYFTDEYDPDVERRVLELMGDDDIDLILAYHQEYDDVITDADFWDIEYGYNDLTWYDDRAQDGYDADGDGYYAEYMSKEKWVLWGTWDENQNVGGYTYVVIANKDALAGNYIFIADAMIDQWEGDDMTADNGEAIVLCHELGHSIGILQLRGQSEKYDPDRYSIMSTMNVENALYMEGNWYYSASYWGTKNLNYYSK